MGLVDDSKDTGDSLTYSTNTRQFRCGSRARHLGYTEVVQLLNFFILNFGVSSTLPYDSFLLFQKESDSNVTKLAGD